jgi:hypothetical protein
MDSNNGKVAASEVFKLALGDINHLFRRSGLKGNSLSLFRYNAEEYAVTSPSQWFKTLADSPVFNNIALLLLEPDLKILFHSGGSAAADELHYAFLSAKTETVLAQFTNSQGELLNLFFPDGETYIQWWASIYSTEGIGDYKQLFTEQEEIETLVCALHCIDIYRRTYIESMLDYRTMVDTAIRVQDYGKLLKKAMASDDTRWLLPSLFKLTPGLKNVGLDLKPKPSHLKRMEEIGFIKINDSSILTLQDISKALGTEFLMTWMGAVGWQAFTLLNGEERSRSQLFMAPTAFTNHLFSFEAEDGSAYNFRHQTVSRADLINTLQQWMERLREAAEVTGDAPLEQPLPISKAKFCAQCGSKIRPDKKFCANCGTPI